MQIESGEYPTNVLQDEKEKDLVVSLGSRAELHCYAVGYPYPSVTWWRENKMLAFKTEQLEQTQDHTLLIHTIRLSDLGLYTCQAYNGVGKAVSWTVTLKAIGPVYNTNPEDDKYMPYVVDPYERPTTVMPYYPSKPSYNSPAPVYRPPAQIRPEPNEIVPEVRPAPRPSPPPRPIYNGNFLIVLLTRIKN